MVHAACRLPVGSFRYSLWFQLASLHIIHVRWSYRGSRAFGTNFHFFVRICRFCVKIMVQDEEKLKGSAQANLEQNRQRFERKKIDLFRSGGEHSRSGGEHSRTGGERSPVKAHTSPRSRSWAWRIHKTLTNLLATKRFVAMGSFVERSHLLTAVSAVARAWRYRLCPRHAPGLLWPMW